ncbi:hypothetical protein ACS7YY_002480 [Enterococcus faecalis]
MARVRVYVYDDSIVIKDELKGLFEFSGDIRLFKMKKVQDKFVEEKQMKFFEIRYPYFALISAEDEKQCLKLYKDIVCEVEDEKEFFDDMKTIDKYEAFKMLAKSHTEEGDKTGPEEAFNQLENLEENGEVLLIDGGLI